MKDKSILVGCALGLSGMMFLGGAPPSAIAITLPIIYLIGVMI